VDTPQQVRLRLRHAILLLWFHILHKRPASFLDASITDNITDNTPDNITGDTPDNITGDTTGDTTDNKEEEWSLYFSLLTRFSEELREADATCFSGHLSRLVNTLVGFHPDIHLNIGGKEQFKMYLRKALEDIMERADQLGHNGNGKRSRNDSISSEQVLDDMTTEDMMIVRKWVEINRYEIFKRVWYNSSGVYTPHQFHPFLSEAWNDLFPPLSNLLEPNWMDTVHIFTLSILRLPTFPTFTTFPFFPTFHIPLFDEFCNKMKTITQFIHI
jgi:hypothetical protein